MNQVDEHDKSACESKSIFQVASLVSDCRHFPKLVHRNATYDNFALKYCNGDQVQLITY